MCSGITKTGKQCTRKADWCKQHINQKTEEPIVESVVEPKAQSIAVDDYDTSDYDDVSDDEDEIATPEVDAKADAGDDYDTSDYDDVSDDEDEIATPEAKSAPIKNNSKSATEWPQFDFCACGEESLPIENVYAEDRMIFEIIANNASSIKIYESDAEYQKLKEDGVLKSMNVRLRIPYYKCSESEFDGTQNTAHLITLRFESKDSYSAAMEKYKLIGDTYSPMQIIGASKMYNHYLVDLCRLIGKNWFNDRNNMWHFTRMIYQMREPPIVNRNTFIMILSEKFDEQFHMNRELETYDTQGPNDKYAIKIDISKLKSAAGGSDSNGYAEWKAKYEPEADKKSSKRSPAASSSLSEAFDDSFKSARIIQRITDMLCNMNLTFEDFRGIIIDDSFSSTELAFWFEEHIYGRIENAMRLNRLGKFRHFEQMLKTIAFKSYAIAQRFIAFFIHEYFLFFVGDQKHCYLKRTPTEDNPNPLETIDVAIFAAIKMSTGETKSSMSSIMTTIPYHRFEYTSYVWGIDPDNKDAFSMAYPFNITGDDIIVTEADLPDILMYYLKSILCNNSEERWDWSRSYMANMVHQPNQQTGVMLVLYSIAKRVGKSTFKWLLEQIINTANVYTANHLGEVFGIRGAPMAVGKRLVWFGELSSSNKDFREYMDKMKSAITDGCITSRALYKEFQKTRNTNEYIAASNHLVGVLEDRMTVFDLNTEKKGDTEWYAELRAVCTPAVLVKFVTYLKQFTTALPMKPLQTEIFKTMDSNSSEPIAEYINELSESRGHDFARFNNGNATYAMIDDMFEHYTSWARTANEKQLPRSKFKAKVLHFGASNITWDRVRHNNGVRPYVFKFVDGYFTHTDDIIEVI